MGVLVFAEHDGVHIRPGTRSALTVARELAEHFGEPVELVVLGSDLVGNLAGA